MSSNLSKREEPVDAETIDSAKDLIHIGDWYWVTFEDEEWDEDKEKDIVVGEHEELMCVSHVGSNFVRLEVHEGGHGTSRVEIHFKEFHSRTRHEPNWKDVLKGKVKQIQTDLRGAIEEITTKAESLSLVKSEKALPEPGSEQSFLPAIASARPEKYKNDLVKAKDKEFPQLTKKIEDLNEDLATQTRNAYLPDMVKMGRVKEGIEKIEDQLFTVELYVGLGEEVVQIKKGVAASAKEPIAIRQMLLYMDEECLLDYKSGGMDFKTLNQFDKWIAKKKNLDRILPEKRSVVAMQVRRNRKDYGDLHWLITFGWDQKNMESYLLIRNGNNVYRLASGINFTPRLIPKEGDLMSKKAFTKTETHHRGWDKDDNKIPDEVTEERINPDHIKYDKFLAKEMCRIKQYNRIVLVLQGLIDRTNIFHPMPRVNLTNPDMVMKWCRLIRDEEKVLSTPPVPWEEYRDTLNKSLRKDSIIFRADGLKRGEWSDGGYRRRPWNESSPPDFSYVDEIKKDRSEVRISWPWGMTVTRWYGYREEDEAHMSKRRRHAWVPMENVFNVSAYNLGDYEMFLLNRSARASYLQWSRCLLAAEDFKRGDLKGYKGPDRTEYYQR